LPDRFNLCENRYDFLKFIIHTINRRDAHTSGLHRWRRWRRYGDTLWQAAECQRRRAQQDKCGDGDNPALPAACQSSGAPISLRWG